MTLAQTPCWRAGVIGVGQMAGASFDYSLKNWRILMIVKLEVTASEKIAARSQYEPNGYSVLVAVENLEIQDADEIQAHASTLFRRAKEAIQTAQREDGIGMPKPLAEAPSTPRNGEHLASPKQIELVHSLAKRAGMDEARLQEFAGRAVGGLKALSKFDASRLINALQDAAPKANGRAR